MLQIFHQYKTEGSRNCQPLSAPAPGVKHSGTHSHTQELVESSRKLPSGGGCCYFHFSKQASCDMEKLSTSLKVRQLVEKDDMCPEQLPLSEPQGCATPGCWVESLHLSPLAGCHHQPAEEWAEKHGLRTSSYLSAESRFLECEMRSPPASHNMALLRLIRHRLLVSRSSVTAVHRGEETWETLLLHQPPLLLGRRAGTRIRTRGAQVHSLLPLVTFSAVFPLVTRAPSGEARDRAGTGEKLSHGL